MGERSEPHTGCSIEISRDIYYKYSTLPRGISVYIASKVGIFFPRPETEGNILYRGCNICRHFTRVRVEYLVYYISTRTDQFDWSVSHAYVINIYVGLYVYVCQINCVGGITWTKHAHAQIQVFGLLKPTCDTHIIHLDYTLEQL